MQIIQGCSFLLGAFQKGSCLTIGVTFVPNITAYQQLDAEVKQKVKVAKSKSKVAENLLV